MIGPRNPTNVLNEKTLFPDVVKIRRNRNSETAVFPSEVCCAVDAREEIAPFSANAVTTANSTNRI